MDLETPAFNGDLASIRTRTSSPLHLLMVAFFLLLARYVPNVAKEEL